MQIDFYTQAIFTSPAESREDILPAGADQERFVAPHLNCPERNRDPDPIQTGAGNLGKILFSLQDILRPEWSWSREIDSGSLTIKVL